MFLLGFQGSCFKNCSPVFDLIKQFEELESRLLASFRIIHPVTTDHVEAARLKNRCLKRGMNVSGPDCLIAAITIAGGHELFAIDADFESIAKIAPLKLFSPKKVT